MKFSTDYMKLVQLLDSEFFYRLSDPSDELLQRDINRAKTIRDLVKQMIEDKSNFNTGLMSMMPLFKAALSRGAVLKRVVLGVKSSDVMALRTDQSRCETFISVEDDVICELKALLVPINQFLKEHEPYFLQNTVGGAL